MMNILLILPEDIRGTRRGGVTTSSIILAKHLAKLDNDVTLLSRAANNSYFYQDGYKVYRLAYLKFKKNITQKFFYYIFNKAIKKILPEFAGRVLWSFEVFSFVKKYGPFDIIDSPEWCNSSLFISLFTKSKVIVKLHRGWYFYLKDNDLPMGIDEWLVCLLEFLSIILATGLISPSEFMISKYKEFLSSFTKIINRKIIKVIPYGIEAVKRNKPANTKFKYLLSAGRVEKAKGSFLLIKAFKKVLENHKDIRLLLIGEDTKMYVDNKPVSYKSFLRSYISKNHLHKKILLLPKKTFAELAKYYRGCLFFIAPSVGAENLPMVLLEAVSNNKALIGSNTGGIAEIVKNRVNGLLFTSGDESDLANKISLLLDNNKLRLKFEQYNTNHKKLFDADYVSLQTLSFYNKVIRS